MYTKTCLQIACSPRFTKASFLGSHGNSSSAVSGLTGSPIFPNMPKEISFSGGGGCHDFREDGDHSTPLPLLQQFEAPAGCVNLHLSGHGGQGS